MSKVTPHPLLSGLSGKSGRVVFRRRGRDIYVDRAPAPSNREPTAKQLTQQTAFKAAQTYARVVLADPCQRRVYAALAKQLGRRIDKIVESDYLRPPVVEHIELSDYHGKPGDIIRVIAVDDIEVVAVDVAINTASGEKLEAGPATKVHGVWQYVATQLRPAGQSLTIEATAKDRPGHEGRMRVTVG